MRLRTVAESLALSLSGSTIMEPTFWQGMQQHSLLQCAKRIIVLFFLLILDQFQVPQDCKWASAQQPGMK